MKTTLICLAAFTCLILLCSLLSRPLRYIRIEKVVTISAAPAQIYPMIALLENFPRWSPFLVQDPSQKYEIKGTDGAPGAQYHWLGNKGKDADYQEIVALVPERAVHLRCEIAKPFKAQPKFDYTLEPQGAATQVRQVFELHSGGVDAFFLWLFGIRKKMEATNEQGLQLLKQAVEKI